MCTFDHLMQYADAYAHLDILLLSNNMNSLKCDEKNGFQIQRDRTICIAISF